MAYPHAAVCVSEIARHCPAESHVRYSGAEVCGIPSIACGTREARASHVMGRTYATIPWPMHPSCSGVIVTDACFRETGLALLSLNMTKILLLLLLFISYQRLV